MAEDSVVLRTWRGAAHVPAGAQTFAHPISV